MCFLCSISSLIIKPKLLAWRHISAMTNVTDVLVASSDVFLSCSRWTVQLLHPNRSVPLSYRPTTNLYRVRSVIWVAFVIETDKIAYQTTPVLEVLLSGTKH